MGQWDQRRNKNIPWKKWKWGHNNPKFVGHVESNTKRETHSITGLSQKTRKSSNKQSNFILTGAWKRKQQVKPKVSRRKEIIKISESINEIESKNWYRRLMNPRAGFLKNKKDWQNFYQDDQEKKGRHK